MPVLVLQAAAGSSGLLDAFLCKRNIRPACELIGVVPCRLAVSHKDDFVEFFGRGDSWFHCKIDYNMHGWRHFIPELHRCAASFKLFDDIIKNDDS